MTIGDRVDNTISKAKGKGNQVAGDLTGDERQRTRGHMQELKGDLGDVKADVKDALKGDRR